MNRWARIQAANASSVPPEIDDPASVTLGNVRDHVVDTAWHFIVGEFADLAEASGVPPYIGATLRAGARTPFDGGEAPVRNTLVMLSRSRLAAVAEGVTAAIRPCRTTEYRLAGLKRALAAYHDATGRDATGPCTDCGQTAPVWGDGHARCHGCGPAIEWTEADVALEERVARLAGGGR